eukprot:Gb_01876 [translate_table: standard]
MNVIALSKSNSALTSLNFLQVFALRVGMCSSGIRVDVKSQLRFEGGLVEHGNYLFFTQFQNYIEASTKPYVMMCKQVLVPKWQRTLLACMKSVTLHDQRTVKMWEEPHISIIASITNNNHAIVSCVDDERPEFQDGDLVVFTEVQGMIELNDGKRRRIKIAKPYCSFLRKT